EALGPVVATASGYLSIPGWLSGTFREDYFFHRPADPRIELDTSGMLATESEAVQELRWWTVEELENTEQTVFPVGLAALTADLLAGRIPTPPRRLPWRERTGAGGET
ncbi:MAG: hypothetical protein J2P18_11650, partial [Nocardia sp.]|nr:hypothetical protein [Nocardia sp.]